MIREEREYAIKYLQMCIDERKNSCHGENTFSVRVFGMAIEALRQDPDADKCEYHTDHTDCIWYGNDSGCPATCSQYRDGWNDAMGYIFKDGKGYQPYRQEE